MCGIFGWFGAAPGDPVSLVGASLRLLSHRGPDDQGFESGPGWALGFRRLAILDLSPTGHQPMWSANGRWAIVFNGEIYNFVELREELERSGAVFRGTSDTEVLLALLARDGVEAFARLNGMFALALVDVVGRTFLLARDRLGVKPLYFSQSARGIRFSSELKGLLVWPDASREIEPGAVAEYVALNYLANETSIFRGYRKLAPGHYLQGSLDSPGDAEARCYWRPPLGGDDDARPLGEADLEELLALLGDAVRVRLRSDVPVGIFLSGGIDSGLVAALAGRAANAVRPLALTVGFSEEGYDETRLARATAESAGLEHRIVEQRASGLDDVDRMAWFYDEPFGDESALPTFALCRAAAAHGTVFLAGDGGDEAFAGYRRYVEARRYAALGRLPAWLGAGLGRAAALLPDASLLRSRLTKIALPDAGFAAVFDTLPEDPMLSSVLHPDLRDHRATAAAPLWERWRATRGAPLTARQQWLDYAHFLPDDILVKVDRASMAHSLEIRSPFLDVRVVEWAARLPRAALIDANGGKAPLRSLAERLLPAVVRSARKKGFGAPVGEWFRRPTGEAMVRERLLGDAAARLRLWDVGGVERAFAIHRSGRGRDFGSLLWRLLMLEAWVRQYVPPGRFLAGPPAAPRSEGGSVRPVRRVSEAT